MYFEEYELGAVRKSRGRTITEADVVSFAGLSGDFVELHVNEEYARKGPFGRRIAHGALIFSISTGLGVQMSPGDEEIIAFYGVDRLRFIKPVFIGDTVHITKKVIEKKPRDNGRGVIAYETTVFNQNNEPVIVYVDRLMVRARS